MREIKTVGIGGAGVMGRQIAVNAAIAGFDVNLLVLEWDKDIDKWCRNFFSKNIEKGKIDKNAAQAAFDRIHFCTSIEACVKHVELIIEALVEKEKIKKDFFRETNRFADKEAILTSNSSYIPSSVYADMVDNAGRLANLHYFNPVASMKLVEIVRGEHTSYETIKALQEFAVKIGKQSIVVNKEIEGFVVNRLLRAVQNEAYFLYENGIASFEDIDIAAEKGLNYPMGPFRLVDLTGIDLNYFNRLKTFEKTGDEKDRPPKFLEEKYRKGEFGRKTGKGWYVYK